MKKLLYILSIIMMSVACTDLTEEVYDKLPSDVYPENEEQVAGLAVDAYAKMKDLVDDAGWWFLAQETTSDELVFPTRDTDWDDGGKWRVLHQHAWTNDVDAVNSMWGNIFGAVTRCNQIVDQMNQMPQSDLIDAKIMEVETMRSFYYYLLMDNYGPIPYLTSAEDVPEQPFRLNRTEVFNNITTQLEEALPALKAIDNKYMATRYMAYSLLAKLYMNAEVYTGTAQNGKAEAYVDSVLAGPYSLESNVMAPFVTDNSSSSEIIFSIPYDEDDFQGFRIHMRSLHYNSNLTYDMNVGPWNGCAVVKDFYDLYEATDARKSYFLEGPQTDSKGQPIMWEPEKDVQIQLDLNPVIPALQMNTSDNTPAEIKASGARVVKYEIAKGAKENLSNDFVLFRLTDFMLMKAELVLLRGGNADDYVNPLRVRAGVGEYAGLTLDELKNERGREMFLEGHRRQDLIRWGDFTKAWWEKDASTAERTIFPVPKWASDANPNLLEDPM